MNISLARIALICISALAALSSVTPAYAWPNNEILFIFNHGSSKRFGLDCYFPIFNPRPQWLDEINGQIVDGKKIRVVTPCSGFERGRNPDANGCNQSWVCNRARMITFFIERYRKRGYPAENIFVGGQSAGGWASLLIKRWKPELFNGVIVTAPAFNGKRRGRMCGENGCAGKEGAKKWWNSHYRYQHELQLGIMGDQRPDLRALVFTFLCDPYARPAELSFGNPSVKQYVYPNDIGKALRCAKVPKEKRYRYLTKSNRIMVNRCDEPKEPPRNLACGSGKTEHQSYAQILGCPQGLKEICKRDQHTRTHRSDDFRNYVSEKGRVIKFITARMMDGWEPPQPRNRGRTACSFLKFSDKCPPYPY